MEKEAILVQAEEVEPIINTEYEKYEISKTMALDIARGLPSILKDRESLFALSAEVLSMDINDPKTAKKASEVRKLIKDNRTKGIDVWKGNVKEVYLRACQFIDATYKREITISKDEESRLEAIEKHQENLELERRRVLHEERKSIVAPYIPEGTTLPDLSDMAQDVFDAYLSAKKAAFEAKIAAEKKAEEERIEAQKKLELHNKRKEIFLPLYDFWPNRTEEYSFSDLSEDEFNELHNQAKENKVNHELKQKEIEAENKKLKEEAERKQAEIEKERKEREIALELERKAAQDKADKERKEREAIEEQLRKEKEYREAELKKKQDEEQAEKQRLEQLAKAGDKAILTDWIMSQFKVPELVNVSEQGKTVHDNIIIKYMSFKKWAQEQVDSL